MEIIARKRRGGKTTELIKRSADTGGYIVCRSKDEAHRILGMAQEIELNIPLPLTYHEFKDRLYYGRGIGHVLIDNADEFLQEMFAIHISAITITPSGKEGE